MKVGGSSAEPRAALGKGNGIDGKGGKDVHGEGRGRGCIWGTEGIYKWKSHLLDVGRVGKEGSNRRKVRQERSA